LLVTYLFGSCGLLVELLLTEHTEGIWQLIPVGLIVLSFPALVWLWLSRKRVAIRVFQGAMVLVALSGLLGMWLHFDGKAEFKLEIDPELGGWALFWECIHGRSLPPVLAPGAMILLGMIGMACTHRDLSLHCKKNNQ
jgi:hypothetical protein